uniref:Uncharacterized protein n=1 Tax=Fagus sylvatica TaxID=28930 RepID=A0A2N9HPY0_FAGSY
MSKRVKRGEVGSRERKGKENDKMKGKGRAGPEVVGPRLAHGPSCAAHDGHARVPKTAPFHHFKPPNRLFASRPIFSKPDASQTLGMPTPEGLARKPRQNYATAVGPIWEATFAQRFSPTRCNLVREPRPLGKRFTSATTRNFRIVKSSSGQAGISVKKLTPWHKEHSDGLRSQDHILRTQSSPLCKACTVKKVFLTRNKLICEPGHIGKRTHPCTTWNSRIAKNLYRVQARIPANPEPCKNRQRKLSDGTKNVKIRHRELGQICARTGTRFEKKRAGSKTHFFSRTAAFARRVFPARNKLIREPGCVGKIMTPATSWNSRFADSIPRLTGICIGKSAQKQLRHPDFREP